MNAWAAMMIGAGGLFAGRRDDLRVVTHPPLAADTAGTVRPRLRAHDPPRRQGPARSAADGDRLGSGLRVYRRVHRRVLALPGGGGFLTSLIGSAAALIPLQRRILTASPRPVRRPGGDADALVPRSPRPLGPSVISFIAVAATI